MSANGETSGYEVPSIWLPSLYAGAGVGLLSGLPYIEDVNKACCALVIGCGFLASFLYSKHCRAAGAPFSPGRGALVGLFAGVVHGVVSSVVSSIVLHFSGGFQKVLDKVDEAMASNPQAAEMAGKVMDFLETIGPFGIFVISLVFAVIAGAIFATIGGLIGGAVFKIQPDLESEMPEQPPLD